jgi:hypothetical protein
MALMSLLSPRRLAVASSCVALLSLISSSARAQDEPAPPTKQFGDKGTFALSLNHNLLVNAQDLLSGEEVHAAFFVAQGLSLGLGVGVQWLQGSPSQNGLTSTEIIFHPSARVGYDLRFSELVSLWMQAGIDYRRLDSTQPNTSPTSGPGGNTVDNAFGISLLAPVLIHPTRGFFVGAGPALYADLVNATTAPSTSTTSTTTDNSKVTSVGLIATIGGNI